MVVKKKIERTRAVIAIVTAFLFSTLLFSLLHLFGEWTVSDEIIKSYDDNDVLHISPNQSGIIMKSTILDFYNECLILNESHTALLFTEQDKKISQDRFGSFRIAKSIEFSLGGHLLAVLLVSILVIPLFYLLIGIWFKGN